MLPTSSPGRSWKPRPLPAPAGAMRREKWRARSVSCAASCLRPLSTGACESRTAFRSDDNATSQFTRTKPMTASDPDGRAPLEASLARQLISRGSLQDGSFLERVRAIPGLAVRSDRELEASLDETLAARPTGGPVWLFGYGSLMWNPAFSYVVRRKGTLRGWHRQFCMWMRLGRGTPEQPGLTLALDRGGTTHGVAFRLAQSEERAELLLVWRREMFRDAYRARWVTLATDEGPVRAITLVV